MEWSMGLDMDRSSDMDRGWGMGRGTERSSDMGRGWGSVMDRGSGKGRGRDMGTKRIGNQVKCGCYDRGLREVSVNRSLNVKVQGHGNLWQLWDLYGGTARDMMDGRAWQRLMNYRLSVKLLWLLVHNWSVWWWCSSLLYNLWSSRLLYTRLLY